MSANISLEQAVTEYFRHKSWATPRELVNQLHPLFQKPYWYPKDTLRRLIHRILNKNYEIVPHSIRPFYVHKNSLDWFNLFISQQAQSNRLEILYYEGFMIPYTGEIEISSDNPCPNCLSTIDYVINGEVVIIPNILKSEIKNKFALMIFKGNLKSDNSKHSDMSRQTFSNQNQRILEAIFRHEKMELELRVKT